MKTVSALKCHRARCRPVYTCFYCERRCCEHRCSNKWPRPTENGTWIAVCGQCRMARRDVPLRDQLAENARIIDRWKGKSNMKQSIPPEIVEHQSRFHKDAWRRYTLAELGNAVAFFVKRAGHRTERAKAEKDLTDAQNYLAMMRQHVEDAQLKLGPGLSEQG